MTTKYGNLIATLAIVLASIALSLEIVQWRAGETLDRLEQGQPVRVGYALEAPYVELGADRRVTGTEPELLRLALASAGIDNIEWLHADFPALLNELQTGRIDIVCAGMFDTPERQRVAAFTRPTMRMVSGLALRPETAARVRSLADVAADPQLRLGVLAGSVEQVSALQAGIPERRIVAFPDVLNATESFSRDEIDALALSLISLRRVRATPGLEDTVLVEHRPVDSGEVNAQPAFAVRTGDRELIERLNRSLDDLVGSARHLELLRRFGVPDEHLPEKASP